MARTIESTMMLTRENIRSILSTVSPLTTREMAEFFLNVPHRHVASALRGMRTAVNKQVYIESWTRDNNYGRELLRAQYALGSLPDAKKPPNFTNKQRCKRWRKKQHGFTPNTLAPNSVFAWAKQLAKGA